MKRNDPATKTPKPRSAPRVIHLEYLDPRARAVFVAGSFNDWHPTVSEMLNVGSGRWVKELTLAPGAYEYRLVVDGEWKSDPACPEHLPNPFGSDNSLLRVSP